ncbi:bis(5'-nucleosyl)-tetraphosphatase (symmetrical) YqeK [Sporosarcina cyprini]|uniref:bis(5'-nucleosyl)-tetraphosphatase (symmetrical) YqeK n=1 Tax=Sporosarcina cyprini TaxID=2910523 RepID=UPI001EE116DD|nr:bis(5'-nucleosyl)-tetraphosphatase (symmetrical) YqeK [Sporosarcina cyprini]MCG3089190.1 bis(5'-nucleosyl)-tetraphosphatase (symmetrical) YqeK [Sporosarcina cyprini]
MLIEELKREVEKRLPSRRVAHVFRVAETATALASLYSVDQEKVEIAALCHDIAKAMERDKLRSIIEDNGMDRRYLSYPHELWHAPAGTVIAKKEFGITDEDILNAIMYHTTGRRGMSDLEKLIYIADLIEPGRDFAGVEDLRLIAQLSLDDAMKASISHSLQYLIVQQAMIFPDSLECYNEHVQKED